jgi:hypothetical protein
MTESDKDIGREKAVAFFERAEEVAETDSFDYAIEMYLDGLQLSPDELESGHIPLRHMALVRQGKGGKKPSIMDKVKCRAGKNPLEDMLNAEFLLAKDPDHLPYAESMLKACVAGGYNRTAEWIAQLIFDANNASSKPSKATYILLKDCYCKLELFEKAVAACRYALEIDSKDAPLRDELMGITANMTVQKGKYGQDGDFRDSIRNREKQQRLHDQQRVIKTADFRAETVADAREAFAAAPKSPVAIMKLADALAGLDSKNSWVEADEILEKAYVDSGDFSFKRHQGQLRIKKLKSQLHYAKTAAAAEPDNEQLKNNYRAVYKQFDEVELAHYGDCVQNYPTDLRMKYEYGRSLLKNKEYDQAIPLLQQSQKDPGYKLLAMDKVGLCFFLKGWLNDAIDVFLVAIKNCELKDSEIGKELQYNLARSYEQSQQAGKALEIYRKLAQLDFGYKDIAKRIEKLRSLQ